MFFESTATIDNQTVANMLQTMPGDRFNISADAWYDGTTTPQQSAGAEDVIGSLMSALTHGANFEGVPLSELPDNMRTVSGILNHPDLASQLGNLLNTNSNENAPKAHLNYLFFNDKMELLPGNSGVVQVPTTPMGWTNIDPSMVTGSQTGTPATGQIATTEPGWLIVYIDNLTIGQDVWFDNVMISQYHGEVAEEIHYYPFGLTMNTAPMVTGVTENPYKYQTIELERHFGIETYGTPNRGIDPQTGRMNQIDPKAGEKKDYTSMDDNPVSKTDPLGLFSTNVIANRDQTHTVVGGKADGDRNIYVMNNATEQKKTGEVMVRA